MRPRELVVVKLGGTTLAEQADTLAEIADKSTERDQVLVHGGGKRLSDWLGRLGVESRFEDGLRVTDDEALEVAVAVLRGLVNAELVATLRGLGADAVGLSGIDGGLLTAKRVPGLGRVATVTGADRELMRLLLADGRMPVIAPLALDEDGVICNVNADDAAAGVAGALGASLILLTDADGVRGQDGSRLADLDPDQAERLITDGVISGGMVPKVRSALRALDAGAPLAVIADGSASGALDRALNDPSFGTRLRSPAAAGAAPEGRASLAPDA